MSEFERFEVFAGELVRFHRGALSWAETESDGTAREVARALVLIVVVMAINVALSPAVEVARLLVRAGVGLLPPEHR